MFDVRVAVVGDVMLDEYVEGNVDRTNPEAPVPILHAKKKFIRLGGAANVAANVASLGAKCTLFGGVGDDKLQKLCKGIDTELYAYKEHTIVKKRFVCKGQQLLRVDWEEKEELPDKYIDEIIEKLKEHDVIILSDYAKGFLTEKLVERIKKLDIMVFADPKPVHVNWFKGVYALTPNYGEAVAMSGLTSFEEAGFALQKMLECVIIMTRSEDGVSVFDKHHHYIPTNAKEVVDVCGAGDTFIATCAVAHASGASLSDSVMMANVAAGIVVGKPGTATVSAAELKAALEPIKKKVVSADKVGGLVSGKVVFTSGFFDVLQKGHVDLLRKAKSFGDVLVLGLNSDASIQRLKGKTVNDQHDRADILSELSCVDYVVFFDEDTPEQLISLLKPAVVVKGKDYDPSDYKRMPEAKIIREYGGEIRIVEFEE